MNISWINQQQDYIYFLYVFTLLFLVIICRKVYKGNEEYTYWRYFYYFLLFITAKYFFLLLKQLFRFESLISFIPLLITVIAYAYLILFITAKRFTYLNKIALTVYFVLSISLLFIYNLSSEAVYLACLCILQAVIGFLSAVTIIKTYSKSSYFIHTAMALFIESIHSIMLYAVDENVYVDLIVLAMLFLQLFVSRVRYFYISMRNKSAIQKSAIIIDLLLTSLLITGFVFINITESIILNVEKYESSIAVLNDIAGKLRGTGIILILILALVIMLLAQYYQKAREEQQRASQYLSLAGAFIVLIDRWGNIRLINKKGCSILGSDEKDIIGQNWFDNYIPTNLVDTMKQVFNQIVRGEIAPVEFYENEIITTNKEVRLIKWTNTAVKDDNGRIVGVLSSGDDVTEIKQMEKSLRRAKSEAEAANVAKGRFLANMSHEIRTPINAIMGFAQLLLQSQMDFRHKDYVAKIRVASKTLLSIINDILDFSKIESGKVELENIPFEMDDILVQISDLFSFDASEKNVELVFDVDNEISTHLIGDSLRLGQVLVNLVGNAIKFTEEGQVILRIRKKACEKREALLLEFSVIDTGIGISKDKLNTLFQPFHQADSSTSRRFGGTGLGLSICHSLVHVMGGSIDVESSLGEGSTFRFSIELGIGQILDENRSKDDLAGNRALIIEDNTLVAEILTNMLKSYGISSETLVAEVDNTTFIKDFENKSFDIIIAKCRNNDMDESCIINSIRKMEIHKNTPIMLTTTEFESDGLLHKAERMSIDHVITKPIIGKEFIDLISKILQNKHNFKIEADEDIKNEVSIDRGVINVLLVEDNRMNRLLMVEMLLTLGMEVDAAINGKEALIMLTSEPEKYDIIFMDIMMPVMNGIEATVSIRSEARFKDMPIIAMSADISKEDRHRSIISGMNEHINKPVDIEQIRSVIKRFVTKKSASIDAKKELTKLNEKQIEIVNKIKEIKADGVDIEKGLQKINYNIEMYKELLKTFSKQLKESYYDLENLHKQREFDKMGEIIHEVKGVSGNLCIDSIFELFIRLSKSVKDKDYSETAKLIYEFNSNLALYLQTLTLIREQLPDDFKKVVVPEDKKVGEILYKLKSSLRLNSFEAEHELDYLKVILSDTYYKNEVAKIKENIDMLNFDVALELVELLEKRLFEAM